MKEFTELIGRTYGELTIIKRDEDFISKSGKHYIMLLCKCSCGNTCSKLKNDVLSGKTTSCGHYRKITTCKTGKNNKKYNTYDLSGEYGIGYTSKGEEFYFDLEDYDKIKKYNWCIHNGYVQSIDENHNMVSFHRIIMGVNDISFNEVIVDHVKTDKKNDNRKENLRIGTQSNNNMNKKISSNNTSGVKGVYWHKGIQKWVANIVLNKETIYLGTFDSTDFERAVSVRKEAENKYFGEWNYDENNV